MRDDEPRALQPEEREEEPDADRERVAQVHRDRAHDRGAEPGHGHDGEDHAGPEHDAERGGHGTFWPSTIPKVKNALMPIPAPRRRAASRRGP